MSGNSRMILTTWITDAAGERKLYSFSQDLEGITDPDALDLIYEYLCCKIAFRLARKNELFGHTIGPAQVEITDREPGDEQGDVLTVSSLPSWVGDRLMHALHLPD